MTPMTVTAVISKLETSLNRCGLWVVPKTRRTTWYCMHRVREMIGASPPIGCLRNHWADTTWGSSAWYQSLRPSQTGRLEARPLGSGGSGQN